MNLPGEADLVASQEELLFAYLDNADKAPTLILELQLTKKEVISKRKREFHEDLESISDIKASRRTGVWKYGEIELFKAGVKVSLLLK